MKKIFLAIPSFTSILSKSMVFVILLIFACSSAKWTKEDTALAVTSSVATLLDAHTTTEMLKKDGNRERDSEFALGKYPDDAEVYLYLGSFQVAILALSYFLPEEWRGFLLGGKTFLNLTVSIHNYKLAK